MKTRGGRTFFSFLALMELAPSTVAACAAIVNKPDAYRADSETTVE